MRRKKLWQLDGPFHCSIIGTCLSVQELESLHRKLRVASRATLQPYELHRAFVGVAGRHSFAARRLHKYLDQKYRTAIRRYAKAQSDSALEALWTDAIASGDLAGPYWAVATHPRASAGLLERVYGEVHMLSHLSGAALRIDMQELHRLQRSARKLELQLTDAHNKAKAQIAERDEAISHLRSRLARAQGAESALADARDRLAAMEREPLALRLRKQVEDHAARLTSERARAERAEAGAGEWRQMATQSADRYLHLEGKLAVIQAERDALDATLERLLSPDCAACPEPDTCQTNVNLCGRCVVYVGGRARQCAHFRALVERQNGRFLHHDGGLHGGRARLGSILPQADAVICPLDCVSHDAAHRVKQFCKRHGKKLVLLPTSSLAAFTRGLNELAA